MKIAYILEGSWGAMPQYTAELANAVASYANVVVVKPKDSNDNYFSEKVEVINAFEPLSFSHKAYMRTISPKNVRSFFSYRNVRVVDKIKPDVVHFPIVYPQSFFAHWYKVDIRHPVVCTLHGVFKSTIVSPFETGTGSSIIALLYSINEFITRLIKVDRIVVHTNENKTGLIKRGINPEKITIIPHGAFTFFTKFGDDIENIAKEENCVLSFGFIAETKGIEVLLKSVPIVSREIPDVKFVLAGEGDLSKYSQDIRKCGSNMEIYNTYLPNELGAALFRRAKIVVLPYIWHQGHSGVLTIAYAFSKPVVVTDVGDLFNLVDGGKTGIVVPPRNPEALAGAIVKLLKDDKLRKQISEYAAKKAEELSWDNIAKRHLEVYTQAIDEHNSRRGRVKR